MDFDPVLVSLSFIFLGLSVGIFYIHAYLVSKEDFTLKGFTIADQRVDKARFANTFAAGTLSLSTVFAFMLAVVSEYGVWLVFAPVTMFLGTFVLAYAIERYGIDVGSDYTQASFVLNVFNSQHLALIITIITALSFIGTVFLELYFGTILLQIFLPEGELFKFLSFLALAILVLGYLRMGGYRVVIITDTWQMYLIGITVVLLLLLSLFMPLSTDVGGITRNIFGNGGTFSIFIFCSWITFLNILQPFGRLSSWQRFAALDTEESPMDAMWGSSTKFFLVWGLPILSFIMFINKGYNINELSEFFGLFTGPVDIITVALFPIVYAGLAAMLLSTIDTRLIAALTSVADSVTFGVRLKRLEEHDPKALKRVATIAVTVLLIFLGVIYLTSQTDFFNLLTTLINVIFNGLTVFAPIIIYGIYKSGINTQDSDYINSDHTWILSLGLILSYFTIIAMSIYGFNTQNETIGQASLFVSLFVMTLFVLIFDYTVTEDE